VPTKIEKMEVIGKIVQILPMQSGVSQRGEWKKQEFIVETSEQYPKKICISGWAERVDQIQQLAVGAEVRVSINLESREFNERWYTDVRAWKIEAAGTNVTAQPNATPPAMDTPAAPVMDAGSDAADDDLPF
jgi:hypothetical protein